jgi:hypothetical protein
VYQCIDTWGAVELPPSPDALASREPDEWRRRVLVAQAQRRGDSVYDRWTFDETGFARNGSPTAERPRFVLVHSSPLLFYACTSEPLRALLARRYVLRRSFEYNRWDPRQAFDPQDAFYLPLAGFDGIERPGPNFELYERRD